MATVTAPRLLPAFAAAGFAATSAQVLLLRELLVCAAGDEASVGAGLAVWLLGITLGAAARRRLPRPAIPAAALLALLSAAAGAGVVALRVLRAAAAPPAGELPGLGLVLLLAGASLLPTGAVVGASFAALGEHAATVLPPPEALARLYLAESAGSLLAGAAASLAVGTLLPPLPAALLAGLASALLVARSGLPGREAARVAVVLLALASLVARPLDEATETTRFAALSPSAPLLAVRDTPHAHLALGGGGPFELWEGGAFSAVFPDPYASEALAHLAASLAESPRRVLALGPVERGLLRFLLRHGPERIDVVVSDPNAFSFVRDHLPREDRLALLDPRVRVVPDDPRRFLSRSNATWDLVLLLGPDPVTLGRARLLTAECFRDVASRLDRRGALVVSLRTASAAVTGATAALGGSVLGALEAALPVVRATPGPDTLLVAGFDPSAVTLDPAVVAARFVRRGLAPGAFAPELFPILLEPANVERIERSLEEASHRVAASRDDRPVSLLHALARRQRETASLAGRAFGALGRLPSPALALLVLLPSAALALRAAARPLALRTAAFHGVASTGAGGMALSFLLLLSYQAREGALYGALGALTAAFMLGLAVGAAASHRFLAPLRPARTLPATLLATGATFAAIAVLLPLLATLSAAPRVAALGAHLSLLLLAGAATGGLFPVAAAALLAAGEDAGKTAARFASADHLGAAAAALLSGVVLVPALGMRATGLLAAALVLSAGAASARTR